MERVKTDIPEFDGLVEGGFPKGFNILLIGMPGTGKTIFGLQYICNGTLKGESGVYVSLDMPDNQLSEQAKQFGWDVEKLEKDGKLSVLKIPIDREKVRIFDMIQEEVQKINATRVVFDSLAAFAINIDQFTVPLAFDDEVTRVLGRSKSVEDGLAYTGNSEKRITYLALNQLSKLNTTNLIITDQTSEANMQTIDGVSEYVCDGVVVLHNELIGIKHVRTFSIMKMRSTQHSPYIHNFEVTSKGIVVKPAEEIYK